MLKRVEPSREAYVIVVLPPQNVAERGFVQTADGYTLRTGDPDKSAGTGNEEPPDYPPTDALLAAGSRIAFEVSVSAEPIRFELEAILALLQTLMPSVVPVALPPELGDQAGCRPAPALSVRQGAIKLAGRLTVPQPLQDQLLRFRESVLGIARRTTDSLAEGVPG